VNTTKNKHGVYIRDGRQTYIIRAHKTRLYKIGSSLQPDVRIEELRNMNADTLVIVKVFPFDIEADLHLRFASQRQHGEWFTESKDLLNLILDKEALVR